MITVQFLLDNKDKINELAYNLSSSDIDFLISLLDEKSDKIRYTAFLVLKKRSEQYSDVYAYWDNFSKKMNNGNSYQRSIGIMLLAENVKWDNENHFKNIIQIYLSHCNDEKFITSRQTIQSINRWIYLQPQFFPLIVDTLISIDIYKLKESQQKLVLKDIISVLLEIQKIEPSKKISDYIVKSITSDFLDKKTIKKMEQLL